MSKTWLLLRKRSSVLLFGVLLPLVAAAELVVGVEKPVSAPELETLTRVSRIDAAATGENILVVWVDTRTDRGSEIMAARLDRFGAIRDVTGFPLTSTPGVFEDLPMVEALGTNFVVVWYSDGNTLAAEVGAGGTIVNGPVVLGVGQPESLIQMERDLAIAISNASGTTISLLRSDLTLAELKFLPRRNQVEMARLGSGLVVTWTEFEFPSNLAVVKAMRLDNRARTIDTVTVSVLGTFERQPEIVLETIGSSVIIAASADTKLAVAKMATDGTTTLLYSIDDANQRTVEDIVFRGGNDFDLLATVSKRARILRFTGDALASENAPMPGNAFDGAGVVTIGRVYAIWQIDGSVIGRFAFASQQEFPLTISKTYTSQQQPDLASNGSNALAVWSEDVNETQDRIVARPIALDGTIDNNSKVTLATRTMLPFASGPVVSAVSAGYAVAWVDQRRGLDKPGTLVVETVSSTGAPGTETTVSTTAHTETPAIANELLVWTDKPIVTAQMRGAFLSNPSNDFEITGLVGSPAVAYGNGRYFVAGNSSDGRVRGATGTPSSPPTSPHFDSNPPSGTFDRDPAVAWDGRTHFLLVFERNDTAIYGRLLDANGNAVGENFPIFTGSGAVDNAAVTWDGYGFIVGWTHTHSDDPYADGDVLAARVLSNGLVEQPATIVSATDRNDDFPSLLGIGFGRTLAAYQRMAGELQNVHRVYTRVLQSKPLTVKRRSVRR